jgi:hypothetical protein
MPSQTHFNSKIFKYIIPAHPCQCRFAKTQFFGSLPKGISDRSYSNSNMLFLPTPESFPKGISIRRCMKISISITPACP